MSEETVTYNAGQNGGRGAAEALPGSGASRELPDLAKDLGCKVDRLRGLLAWIQGYAEAAAAPHAPRRRTVKELSDDLALIAAKCGDALSGNHPPRPAAQDAGDFQEIIGIAAREPNPLLGDLKFKRVGGGAP